MHISYEEVVGILLLNLTSSELKLLDQFEDPGYDRRVVDVRTTDGKSVPARIWATPNSMADNLDLETDWHFRHFLVEDEDWYVEMCEEWVVDAAAAEP
ncbi:hypothetical protein SARC_03278 [Sphaeroforma arctica JP610]|uniref:Putative gamma-glutamylcyclotransferase n=1 Tax=Sphaeroforma arctica JP610 TaxID=667725 RepID=A0A0L0G6C5_9EUKA|nr:hypothetical protein SARC_03278 [Sphaeroforma arctica JP610]KNC84504.1 hypothetical protein SARC_03278 [Sphaeroforma arctica JP610]|eukprot:XP_014158406.1 hypothetical protein SARC_03278 [Sphaeroforma arctica JP610]